MEVIKKKLQETFDKCQERQYNLAKLAETLKKFFSEVRLCSVYLTCIFLRAIV